MSTCCGFPLETSVTENLFDTVMDWAVDEKDSRLASWGKAIVATPVLLGLTMVAAIETIARGALALLALSLIFCDHGKIVRASLWKGTEESAETTILSVMCPVIVWCPSVLKED